MVSKKSSVYRMPFGAQVEQDGVRFRIWSPHLEPQLMVDGHAPITMRRDDDGRYETFLAGIGPGARYRYRLPGPIDVPDPASRFQPDDCTGASVVVDPGLYRWQTPDWRGRPWDEAVIYELHVGTFTPHGSFLAMIAKLDHLKSLGATAIELMPVADFPGKRGWGYDGVLLFAPDSAYGTPDELKAFIDAAHAHGLMVFLDVVYNHFGPQGNHLAKYSPQFFTDRFDTPWGAAINFAGGRQVRDFYVHNALYWLEEYRLDGLRLDAVHAIFDDPAAHILDEIAAAVRSGPGAERAVHLILENDHNESRFLDRERRAHFDAQWNDDVHHALHVLLVHETSEHYQDYAADPISALGRCLTEGFAFQGEWSDFRRARRGEPSGRLPPDAFIDFLQNHDQIGNRALGERIGQLIAPERVRIAAALLLLAPAVPMLFMGEEWNASTPFLYFCDFDADLAAKVRAGRPPQSPDANAPETFLRSKLNWSELARSGHAGALSFYSELLSLRRRLLEQRRGGLQRARWSRLERGGIRVQFDFSGGAALCLLANLSEHEIGAPPEAGELIYSLSPSVPGRSDRSTGRLPGWSMRAHLVTRP